MGASTEPTSREELLAKYRAERDKRLRPDGNEQYIEPTGKYAHFLDDPYVPVEPREPRTDEVTVAQEMLQSMGLGAFSPMVTACPGCGRTTSTFFQSLAQDVQQFVRSRMPEWKMQFEGVESLSLAVMGCVVNGPCESLQADIGISLPGTGEAPVAPVFIDGEKHATLRGEGLTITWMQILDRHGDRTETFFSDVKRSR